MKRILREVGFFLAEASLFPVLKDAYWMPPIEAKLYKATVDDDLDPWPITAYRATSPSSMTAGDNVGHLVPIAIVSARPRNSAYTLMHLWQAQSIYYAECHTAAKEE